MSRTSMRSRLLAVAVAVLVCALGLSPMAGCRSKDANQSGAEGSVATTSPASSPFVITTPKIPVAGKVEPLKSGAYLGVYAPPAPFEIDKVKEFATTAGKDVSIVMWYQPWAVNNRSQFDAGACVAVMRRGKIPMITWEPWDPGTNANDVRDPGNQPAFRLEAINDGTYDDYIRGWAQEIRDLGGPIMLRPMHEMNGRWYPWSGTTNGNSPQEFIKAWRHMHDIFVQEGATNVTWVWSINHESVPGTPANAYAVYYPGDTYVDWTAISGFNWGTSKPDSAWRSFSFWYDTPLAYLKGVGKPIVIAEFGSVEQGGDKAAWLTDAYSRIRKNSLVDAIIYYDALEQGTNNRQDWRISTSARSIASFRKAVAPSYFIDGPPVLLKDWATSLESDEWRYLSTLSSVY